jgi:hypothetical protein
MATQLAEEVAAEEVGMGKDSVVVESAPLAWERRGVEAQPVVAVAVLPRLCL